MLYSLLLTIETRAQCAHCRIIIRGEPPPKQGQIQQPPHQEQAHDPQEPPPGPQPIMTTAVPASGGAVGPPPPPPPFALCPGQTHNVLQFDDPVHGATAMKLYNKAISPMDDKFNGYANNLAVFLATMRDCTLCFNWQHIITIPLANGTIRNLLTHYGQVSIDNVCTHAVTFIGTQTRNAEDNDMFYYFIMDSLTPTFHAKLLLHSNIYLMNGTTATSVL